MANPFQPTHKLIEENALLKSKIQKLEQMSAEKNQLKEILQHSDNRYLTSIQDIPAAVVVHGSETQILDSNLSARKLLGLTEEQLLGKTAIDKDWYFFNADRSIMEMENYPVNRVMATRQPLKDYTLGIHRPHEKLKNHVWVLINANPIFVSDEIVRVIVTFVDITGRKQVEDALLESERKYRNLYHYAHVGLFETSLVDGTIMACNQRYCDLAGFPSTDKAIGMNTLHLYANPSDREKVKRIIEKQGYINDYELQLKNRLNHEFFWAEFSARPDSSRAIIEGTIIDITKRKQAEEELRRLRNYLSNIIDSMPSLLIGVDHEGCVTQWNKKMVETTGITADIALGKSLCDKLPWMVSEMKNVKESIRTRQVIQDPKRCRPMKDGTCYEDITIYPLIANDMEGAVIRIDDVTEKVQLEKMIIQSEKMLSVGGLAAGMAHEINNPLAGMMQTVEVMGNRLNRKLQIQANEKAAEAAGTNMKAIQDFMEARDIFQMLTAIKESGQRIAVIVNNMLSFAQKSDLTISSNSIEALIDKTVGLAATDYDLKKQYDFKNIKIFKEYTNNLPTIPCDGNMIQQVVFNILRNGAQAMLEAGTVDSKFIIRTWFEQDRAMVCVEIEDNGPGMDEDTCKRVFEPFFTTKPVGLGTGLGLSVSYFIITENHRGEMAVESTLGAGSKFKICLPI